MPLYRRSSCRSPVRVKSRNSTINRRGCGHRPRPTGRRAPLNAEFRPPALLRKFPPHHWTIPIPAPKIGVGNYLAVATNSLCKALPPPIQRPCQAHRSSAFGLPQSRGQMRHESFHRSKRAKPLNAATLALKGKLPAGLCLIIIGAEGSRLWSTRRKHYYSPFTRLIPSRIQIAVHSCRSSAGGSACRRCRSGIARSRRGLGPHWRRRPQIGLRAPAWR